MDGNRKYEQFVSCSPAFRGLPLLGDAARSVLLRRLRIFSIASGIRVCDLMRGRMGDIGTFLDVSHPGILSRLIAGFGYLTYGNRHPTLQFTSRKVFSALWSALRPDDGLVKVFDGEPMRSWVVFQGAPLTYHDGCPHNVVVYINEEQSVPLHKGDVSVITDPESLGKYVYLSGWTNINV